MRSEENLELDGAIIALAILYALALSGAVISLASLV